MDSLFQLHCARSISHKVLHQVQLLYRAGLKSTRVMENKAWVCPKNQLVFDVMVSSLSLVSIQVTNHTPNSPLVIPE